MSASKRPSTSSLRRYLTSRPYVAIGDIRRRFALEPDEMSRVSRNGTTAFVGLPEREAAKIEDLWRRDEIGVQLSVEVRAPVIVGVFPMRLARFVIEPHGYVNGTAAAHSSGTAAANGGPPANGDRAPHAAATRHGPHDVDGTPPSAGPESTHYPGDQAAG